jgi:hypothetical protein
MEAWNLSDGEVVLQYISIDEQIYRYFGKDLYPKMKEFMYLRDKLGLVETTSLLEKEVITPRLGGNTDTLLIYGQSFSRFGKWSRMGSSLSSVESGSRFLTDRHFPVRKMVQIGQSLS